MKQLFVKHEKRRERRLFVCEDECLLRGKSNKTVVASFCIEVPAIFAASCILTR
jgi:hypothetical protein